jgi:hypothetical protein
MYKFCEARDLREVWAYLWENWYRPGRWKLWARSTHDAIPVLKTTMICESQYVTSSFSLQITLMPLQLASHQERLPSPSP